MASSQPFSLTVSPARLAAGAANSVRMLTVTNNGMKPVTVRVELTTLSRNTAGKCAVNPLGGVSWAAATPVLFTLSPGKHRTAKLTIGSHVPKGTNDLVTAFVAQPGKNSGVTVAGAVGAQMKVQGNAAPTSTSTHPCLSLSPPKRLVAAKTTAKSSSTVVLLVALLLAVIVLLVWMIFIQRRRMLRRMGPIEKPTGS